MRSRLARLDHRIARRAGAHWVAGCDEVGRGCLAGPVVVAAVAFAPGQELPGVDDSKRLAAERREALFLAIREQAAALRAWAVPVAEVDARNVQGASLHGMARVLSRMSPVPELALVDGHLLPADLPCPGVALVKGDGRSQAIAAASIVAKVLRDRVMRRFDHIYPGYGFASHVGYPTPGHREALARLGPCDLHRRSFAPVARALSQRRLELAD